MKLPIIVHVDNLGTVFMSENVSVSQRTKHVDIRYRFVQEFVLDGFIKVKCENQQQRLRYFHKESWIGFTRASFEEDDY